jgi:hypothetical protein
MVLFDLSSLIFLSSFDPVLSVVATLRVLRASVLDTAVVPLIAIETSRELEPCGISRAIVGLLDRVTSEAAAPPFCERPKSFMSFRYAMTLLRARV